MPRSADKSFLLLFFKKEALFFSLLNRCEIIPLYSPDEMDDGQFSALKDAFERKLTVDVFWVIDDTGDLRVIYVEVYSPPADEPKAP